MRTAIFDLDGTLADTSADLIGAANACFDRPLLDPVRDKRVAFRGGRAMLRLGFERGGGTWVEADVEARFAQFLSAYAARLDAETVLYDGVEATLDQLVQAGWLLGICTNKPFGLAEDLVTRLGIRDRFSALLGADSLPVRKPDARHLLETITRSGGGRERAVLIGDTETDRAAAANASVPCILVRFGPEGAGVDALDPEAVVDHFTEIPGALDRLVPRP